MADAGVWRELKAAFEGAGFKGARITSTYRADSTAAGGGADYHSRGMAIDVAGPEMPKYFEWILVHYPNSREIIYSPAGNRQIKDGKPHTYGEPTKSGHYNHVHWAATSLGEAAQGGSGGTTPSASDSASATTGNPLIPDEIEAVYSFYQFVSDPKLWLRVGAAVAGVVLLIITFLALTKNKVKLPTGIKGIASASQ